LHTETKRGKKRETLFRDREKKVSAEGKVRSPLEGTGPEKQEPRLVGHQAVWDTLDPNFFFFTFLFENSQEIYTCSFLRNGQVKQEG